VGILGWVLLFPLVAPLAITKGQREPVARLIAGATVFVIAAPFWLAAATTGGGGSTSDQAAPPANIAETEDEEAAAEPDSGVENPATAASEQETDGDRPRRG
jgi:hypothetical protein